VLMRVLRGAGMKGLGGIYPKKAVLSCGREEARYIVRPLLEVRRSEVRDYLGSIGQCWCEDATNVDLQYTRNRIRHGLIPLIVARFQPTAVAALAQLAEVAREEENYWEAELSRVMPEVTRLSDTGARLSVNIPRLATHPPALQRRILRNCAQLLGVTLDFDHLESLLRVARCSESRKVRTCELPGCWMVVREQQELRFELRQDSGEQAPLSYEYRLLVPGEVEIREVGRVVRAFLRPVKPGASGYNPEQSLDPAKLGQELVVRNWRPGDRLWPAHGKGLKKMKELLQERHVSPTERRFWPVAVSGGKLAWARGFGVSAEFQPGRDAVQVVVIEEHVLHSQREL
jgi:tRNA(Ile)-lysidine synthase